MNSEEEHTVSNEGSSGRYGEGKVVGGGVEKILATVQLVYRTTVVIPQVPMVSSARSG